MLTKKEEPPQPSRADEVRHGHSFCDPAYRLTFRSSSRRSSRSLTAFAPISHARSVTVCSTSPTPYPVDTPTAIQ
jgi:hypothetical protein